MTASPAPGMPSEEEIARWLCAHEGHTPEQVEALWTEWMDNARELLGMFGSYFEAKEREIERLTNNRDMWKGQCDRQAETIRQLRRSYDLKCSDLEAAEAKLREANMQALSDEGQMREVQAKLARAVEALGPFASYMNDGGDLDAHGNPLPDENGVGWVYLTMGDFRRARAASNIGQNEGATLATSKPTP